MSRIKYSIQTYSIRALAEIIESVSEADMQTALSRPHLDYFRSYFEALGAKTILTEHSYLDQDYLEDYIGYYAGCFFPYERMCARIHFFKHAFTSTDFEQLLERKNSSLTEELLGESYIGFVVIKPLPKYVIGRTALKTYDENSENQRCYPIRRNYDVSLFGIPLRVSSLAFQEQDRAASACATSALWSAFQGTGKLFQHIIPSPIEITNAAFEDRPTNTRALPNDGLTMEQMAEAIRRIGLEPSLINVGNSHPIDPNHIFKATVYAYLRAHIPVMLVGELIKAETNEVLDFHAGTITGYRLKPGPVLSSAGRFKGKLISSSIEKLYVHDDQVGPFARMTLETIAEENGQKTYRSVLSTTFSDSTGSQKYRFLPSYLIVPLHKSIRIPYYKILEDVSACEGVFRLAGSQSDEESGWTQERVWDIYLTTVNDLKADFLSMEANIDAPVRRALLLESLPKYIWRATASSQGNPVLDLLFDSTDIESGKLLAKAVVYRNAHRKWLGKALQKKGPRQLISKSDISVRKIFKKLGNWKGATE